MSPTPPPEPQPVLEPEGTMARPRRGEPSWPAEPPADVRAPRAPTPLDGALREALATLDDPLALVHPDGSVAFANEALARLAGCTPAELVGRPLRAAIPGAEPTLDAPPARQTLADGTPRTFDVALAYADRPAVRLEARATRTAQGLLTLRLRDTTALAALRQAEAQAQRRAEGVQRELALHRELGALVSGTAQGVLRALCALVARECAATQAAVHVRRGDELQPVVVAGPGGDVVSPTHPDAPVAAAQPTADRAAAEGRLQRTADGRATMAVPLVAHDQPLGVLSVTRPVGAPAFSAADEGALDLVAVYCALTLWKLRMLEEAAAASEAKGNFLAAMSHELRTPLTALTGYGELLDDEILGPLTPAQQEMVRRMCSVIQQLTGMIDEMLTFSSLEAGQETVRIGEVASSDLLQAAVAVIEPAARQKGLAVLVRVPPSPPRITTDPEKVRQILGNLAGNAVKFTTAGTITLFVAEGPGEVRFGVQDTGIGIPPGAEARIFQPFTQLDAGLTRRYGGTGLGLYISNRLALLLGGRIEVRSTLGEGSVFELVLPGR